jgi:hypothetical protein
MADDRTTTLTLASRADDIFYNTVGFLGHGSSSSSLTSEHSASILDTTPMALRKVSTMKGLGAKPRIIPPAHRVEKAARGE